MSFPVVASGLPLCRHVSTAHLQEVARVDGIAIEDFYRVQRYLFETPAETTDRRVEFMSDRDDVATHRLSLAYVEDLTWAGPEQFEVGIGVQQFDGLCHQRDRVPACVCNATGKYGNHGTGAARKRVGHSSNLGQREDASNVEVQAVSCQVCDKRT